MSHPQNDAYNEELEMVEEDLKDAMTSLANAEEEVLNAIKWRNERRMAVETWEKRLSEIKNRE